MVELKKLFEPIKIGKMELRNRIVMAPVNTYYSEVGVVGNRLIDYLVERAKGGVGLIIVESTCVDWPVGKAGICPLRIDEWKYVPAFHNLVEAVHQYDTRIAIQIHHAGRQQSIICSEGQELVAPSEVACLATGACKPRALTIDEIEGLEEKFIIAAQMAKWAGFDAVEVHGAHGYLINQFMSPYSNKRTDEYGGDFEGRMRFPVEIVEGIRAATGPDFPILFRLSADEYVEGGLTLDDTKNIARKLETTGVDAIHVAAGIYESKPSWWARIFPVMSMPPGSNVHLAEEIKRAVKIPVIVAGKLGNPILAEEVLKEGKTDLIAMGRPLLADPELPRKAALGELDDIRPCLYCNEGCFGSLNRFWSLRCQVNAAVGREREFEIKPTTKVKHVLVVGGGPGGMEAARVAALRGHKVTLYEKDEKLGGQLILASVPWFKEPIRDLIKYLESQIRKLGVKLELGKEVSPTLVKDLKPEVVILATGATPLTPEIPGIQKDSVVTAVDVLAGRKEVGQRVVIIGGGQVGSETAWFLAEKGKEVTIVEMLPTIVEDMNMASRYYLLAKLRELGVNVMTNKEAKEVTSEGMIVESRGKKQTIEADTVILAVGSRSNKKLKEELEGKVAELYAIGDCVKPGKILEAIHGGSHIARLI